MNDVVPSGSRIAGFKVIMEINRWIACDTRVIGMAGGNTAVALGQHGQAWVGGRRVACPKQTRARQPIAAPIDPGRTRLAALAHAEPMGD